MFIYQHELPLTNSAQTKPGMMHGLLVLAENPFRTPGRPARWLMILWDFSGVATNAMAKFLTEDVYLPSFFGFDDKIHAQPARAVEAVISVKYVIGPGSQNTDSRAIGKAPDSIKFEEIVLLP